MRAKKSMRTTFQVFFPFWAVHNGHETKDLLPVHLNLMSHRWLLRDQSLSDATLISLILIRTLPIWPAFAIPPRYHRVVTIYQPPVSLTRQTSYFNVLRPQIVISLASSFGQHEPHKISPFTISSWNAICGQAAFLLLLVPQEKLNDPDNFGPIPMTYTFRQWLY